MECKSCNHNSPDCDWGNYFQVIDTAPRDFGYHDLGSSESWSATPSDLDALRMTPGCTVEVRVSSGAEFTFSSDVRLCGNEVGCDNVRSIRVYASASTGN